jgi:hypothetical protein
MEHRNKLKEIERLLQGLGGGILIGGSIVPQTWGMLLGGGLIVLSCGLALVGVIRDRRSRRDLGHANPPA